MLYSKNYGGCKFKFLFIKNKLKLNKWIWINAHGGFKRIEQSVEGARRKIKIQRPRGKGQRRKDKVQWIKDAGSAGLKPPCACDACRESEYRISPVLVQSEIFSNFPSTFSVRQDESITKNHAVAVLRWPWCWSKISRKFSKIEHNGRVRSNKSYSTRSSIVLALITGTDSPLKADCPCFSAKTAGGQIGFYTD